MRRILLPFDGSVHALHAAQYLAGLVAEGMKLQVHVLNVQESPPYALSMADESGIRLIEHALRNEGHTVVLKAAEVLAAASVPHQLHVHIGIVAESVVSHAESLGCESIMMGCRGLGALTDLVLGSIATRVVHLSPLPVTLVK